jgi:hypothetical protein
MSPMDESYSLFRLTESIIMSTPFLRMEYCKANIKLESKILNMRHIHTNGLYILCNYVTFKYIHFFIDKLYHF